MVFADEQAPSSDPGDAMMQPDIIERAAMAAYGVFIRRASGSLALKDDHGSLTPETPDEAVARRWRRLPERVRADFRSEAEAALEAA